MAAARSRKGAARLALLAVRSAWTEAAVRRWQLELDWAALPSACASEEVAAGAAHARRLGAAAVGASRARVPRAVPLWVPHWPRALAAAAAWRGGAQAAAAVRVEVAAVFLRRRAQAPADLNPVSLSSPAWHSPMFERRKSCALLNKTKQALFLACSASLPQFELCDGSIPFTWISIRLAEWLDQCRALRSRVTTRAPRAVAASAVGRESD